MKREAYFTLDIVQSHNGFAVAVTKYTDVATAQETTFTDNDDFYGENGIYESEEEAQEELENQRHLLTQAGLIEGIPPIQP
jgi:hypothetical protein